jgi:hypothetical protein
LHYEKSGNKDAALKLYKALAASPENIGDTITEAKAGVVRLGGSL